MCCRCLLVALWICASYSIACYADDSRHVPLEGQSNFRDIGGYKTTDGKTVKRGLVYRSGELPRLTDKDVEKLENLGINNVVNFLTEEEIKSRGHDRLPQSTREVMQPIESDDGLVRLVLEARKTADFSKVPPELNPTFHRKLVDDAKKQYATLFKEIANAQGPLVFHCSHGIHRTGTAAAILLWGLGVPWEIVREDYLLSNKYRSDKIEKRLGQLRELAAKNRGIPLKQVDMKNIRAFYILQKEYIDATREEILLKYGTIEKYLSQALGLTKSDIDQLRLRMLQ